MRSIDTNVVVRFLVADEPDQTAMAEACLQEKAFVSHGVLMEVEWVLRRGYGWDRSHINGAITEFLRLRQVETDLRDALLWALGRHRSGADWADMLHLIAGRYYAPFTTFDRRLARSAGREAPVSIETLK